MILKGIYHNIFRAGSITGQPRRFGRGFLKSKPRGGGYILPTNYMQELFVMMAKIFPEDKITEMIEEDLQAFKLAPSETTKGKLATSCMLFAVKIGTEKRDIADCLKELEHTKNMSKAFKENAY